MRIGCGKFEELADEREIWIHHFQPAGQGIFQRDIILKFSRV